MWPGFRAIRVLKADDGGELLNGPSKYLGPASSDTTSYPVAVPAPAPLPTAHDMAGQFCQPSQDTGVGHAGKHKFNHLGQRIMDPANNAPPNTGSF